MTADSGAEVVHLGKARTARDEPADASPTPVDSAVPTVSGPGVIERIKNSKRMDVFPPWMKSRREFVEALGWLAGHLWHTFAFHTVPVPFVYLPKLVWRSPRGALNILGRIGRWAVDAEGEGLRQYTATNEHVDEYLKLSRQRDRRVRLRMILTVLGFGPADAPLATRAVIKTEV